MKAERCAFCDLPRRDGSWYCEEHSRVVAIYARLNPPERQKKDRIKGVEDRVRTFGQRRQRVSDHEWCSKCGMAAKVGARSCPLC